MGYKKRSFFIKNLNFLSPNKRNENSPVDIFWKQGNEEAKLHFLAESILLNYFSASSSKIHVMLQSLWCRLLLAEYRSFTDMVKLQQVWS